MKLGIVGYGKMGKAIFQYYIERKCVSKLILVCSSKLKVNEATENTEKNLKRKVRRGMINKSEMENWRNRIIISDDYNVLEECELVIETVTENLQTKREVISKIERHISPDSMIVTNTSSLDLEQIFKDSSKDRHLAGLHYFYPLSIFTTVEIGCFSKTSEQDASILKKFVDDNEQIALVLHDENNLLISKILTTIVSYSFEIFQNYEMSLEETGEIVRKNIMAFDPFEVIDSTGFSIITQCLLNLKNERHRGSYENLLIAVNELKEKGYQGGEKGIIAAYNNGDIVKKTQIEQKPLQMIECEMIEDIAKEIVYYTNVKKIEKNILLKALENAIGLNTKVCIKVEELC